ncbi:MAG: dTMP kinase [Negativicutes bacterium]|jgi:dTMP kinase
MKRGLFISLEGPDGSGKTTQVKLLAEFLRAAGHIVIETREPGGTTISDKIRKIILDTANMEMTDRTEALLYAAQRAQHVEEKIVPALERGEIVLTDRFADSTFVYQGLARRLKLADIKALTTFATNGLKPDLTLLLDITPECGEKRMVGRGKKDRLEMVNDSFSKRVRAGYLELAANEPERFRVVNADRSIDEIQTDLRVLTEKFLLDRVRNV